ncbi:ABC transporter ATP-binding protein [Tenggerimyces flavus]|uniref:ABC transporter ATP-binding protein n=1 Tax=Tenggerimyces flavus TaxID=1708749 RepID=A0ABV7YGM1_9ACTN|nr:ATP-binding cassette domain-containing protein [Tenggerimyces flavus]MBM7789188.1 ABC-2 type transport system ATP-binding protein [Tenggerimyces flavus]
MITIRGLTKRYGATVAVDNLSFDVRPGQVTGFLGPNGAGKSTTMRAVLGLDRPTDGQTLIDGRPYRSLREPLRSIGALLEAKAVHPRRSAADHLKALAQSNGIAQGRVDEVLGLVGLSQVAGRRVGQFSLGMSQRLGIASALLGDPPIVMFDEPVNGLDPDGIRWVRELMRGLAAEGRTVFVSSHLMSEMEDTADHLVVIGRGRLVVDAPIADVISESSHTMVRVRTPEAAKLGALLGSSGGVQVSSPEELLVSGLSTDEIGDVAYDNGIRLHELALREASLEQAYLELSREHLDYTGA